MPRKPIGDRPMTDAERQARCRAARVAGKPIIHIRRPADLRSRAQRWRDAVAELATLQAQSAAWLEALPPNLLDSATAEGHCKQPATSPTSRPSSRLAASARTDQVATTRSPRSILDAD